MCTSFITKSVLFLICIHLFYFLSRYITVLATTNLSICALSLLPSCLLKDNTAILLLPYSSFHSVRNLILSLSAGGFQIILSQTPKIPNSGPLSPLAHVPPSLSQCLINISDADVQNCGPRISTVTTSSLGLPHLSYWRSHPSQYSGQRL